MKKIESAPIAGQTPEQTPIAPDAQKAAIQEGIKKVFALISEKNKLEARILVINNELEPLGLTATDYPVTKEQKSAVVSTKVPVTDAHVPQISAFLGKEQKPLAEVSQHFNFHHKNLLKFWNNKKFPAKQQADKKWTISAPKEK